MCPEPVEGHESRFASSARINLGGLVFFAVSLKGNKDPLGHFIDLAEAVDLYQHAA
jgi:hypothetical protein